MIINRYDMLSINLGLREINKVLHLSDAIKSKKEHKQMVKDGRYHFVAHICIDNMLEKLKSRKFQRISHQRKNKETIKFIEQIKKEIIKQRIKI